MIPGTVGTVPTIVTAMQAGITGAGAMPDGTTDGITRTTMAVAIMVDILLHTIMQLHLSPQEGVLPHTTEEPAATAQSIAAALHDRLQQALHAAEAGMKAHATTPQPMAAP